MSEKAMETANEMAAAQEVPAQEEESKNEVQAD